MIRAPHKILLLVLGMVSLASGVIGIFVPILPTVPFLLLAAYFFSKSSDRFHGWLLSHPILSPPIIDWQQRGVIRPRAKVFAIGGITISFVICLLMPQIPWWGKGFLILLYLGLVGFLASRPSGN